MEKPTSSELRAILKSCKDNGVSSLVWGDIKVEFSINPHETTQAAMEPVILGKLEDKEFSLQDRVKKQKEDYEELLEEARLANPALYEELLQREG